jgi:hypothetical protein
MPKLGVKDQSGKYKLKGGFQYSGVRLEKLDASEYSLITLVIDITGSVQGFEDLLLNMVKTIVGTCSGLPTAQNILLRVVLFNSRGINEVHGFKPLIDIDADADYTTFQCYGSTNLYDAVFSSIEATLSEGTRLLKSDYGVNGTVFIITDGDDNASKMLPKDIEAQMGRAAKAEEIEHLDAVLIGVKDKDIAGDDWTQHVSQRLDDFVVGAKLTKYVDIGDATDKAIKKLAWDISESVSSASQAIVTGGQSQLAF